MMKRIFAAAVCTALLSGCASRNDEQIKVLTDIRNQLEQSNKQLEKANEKIAALETKIGNSQWGGAFRTLRVDPGVFAKIKLPENPTREQVSEYLQKIHAASANQNSFSSEDPQVDMYAKIGPGYLDVVLPFMNSLQNPYHLKYALPRLVGKSDKEFVLKNLTQHPQLVQSVLVYGWFPDAKKQIVEVMKSTRQFNEFRNVISLMVSTPEDRATLIEIFRANPRAGSMGDLIESFPGVDLEKLARDIWEKNRFNQNTWEMLFYAVFAAKNGVKEAFPLLFSQALNRRNNMIYMDGSQGLSLSLLINQLLNQNTELDKTFAWYNQNCDRLVFDKKQKQYILSEPVTAK